MPGSRGVCFVCGSPGAELYLHSKARDQGPYFPFLEHHEPPKGCRLPGPEGVVDSCRVCYAFLTQQWETYERNKTPALKRLYWLKRTDELAFTGAEMKLQGEYMAQVMGLQYQPSCHDNCSTAPLSPDDRRPSGFSGAVSGTRESASHESRTGGTPVGRSSSRHLAQSSVVGPQHSSRVRATEPEGALDLTVASKSSESNADAARPPSNRSSATNFRDLIVCFTCGCEMYVMNSKVVSSVRVSTSEPYFPFLEKITPLKGAIPLSRERLTRVCEGCYLSAYQQWIAYERACTPSSARMYRIKDKYFSDGSNSHPAQTEQKTPRVRADEICYLCGQMKSQNQIIPLYTVPPVDQKWTMYFPFIRELRRPQGAQPLNPDGTVLVCSSCNSNLKAQWQHYERESVPLLHRRYTLLPVTTTAPSTMSKSTDSKNGMPMAESRGHQRQKSSDNAADAVDITQPLNIHISKSPVMSSNTAHGLLAIAPHTPRTVTGDISNSSNPMVLSELASSGLNPKNSDLPRGTGLNSSGGGASTSGAPSASAASVPHPLQQATTLPKKVCFLCGEKCLVSKTHLLFSYPVRHEAKSTANNQSPPFFPFLANKDPAPGSELMTDEGTVVSCNYCYFSLISQWKEFEDSKNPADSNRWLRKYSVREFICYICGLNVPRRKIRTLEVQKFHFLKEHKAPSGALVLDGGEAVATCDSCTFSLSHQYAEYERMGVPQELRKYNWTTVPASEENSQDNIDQGGEERWRRGQCSNEDSNLSVVDHGAEGEDSNTGLGQGSKPLALSMLSPASGVKMTPKTATVPPLSQGSPSNGLSLAGVNAAGSGTNSASFSAALRKLAHQAKDPQEEAAVLAAVAKHNGSPINSGSPRSTTPKRAPPPPPLLYTSQTSTLNSPPVVTIAPTQTMSHPTDGRQSNDRVPSAHSAASSYDHFNAKHERDQRPHSSHSRDDDRASAKDSSQTPTRLGAPSSASTSREDGVSRGFHPYRPEDDLHRAAAAAAALPPYSLDPTFAAYHPAFLQHHAAAYQSALRYEEMSAMERFRLMQAAPQFLPFTAGLVPHPAMHPLLSTSARYPPELLHQYPFISPGAQAVDARTSQASADRSKSDEERQQELEREKEREKEKREKELEKEREREREVEQIKREKQREAEREKQRNSEHKERKDILSVPSRYISDRGDGERDSRDSRAHHHQHHHQNQLSNHHQQQHQHHHHHHHHHHPHSMHRSKGGSISQGTPREHDTSHHHSSRPTSRTSEANQDKNHYLSSAAAASSASSYRNHDHFKYENHSLPKQEHHASDLSRQSYHHAISRSDQSKGQPPPLISPHKPSSKGSGENAIFRPFENDRPVNNVTTTKSSDKGHSGAPVLPSQLNISGETSRYNHVSVIDKDKSSTSLTANARMFGTGPEGKLLNSNILINHRIEKFDFKSLARECSSSEGASVPSSELAPKPSVVVVETEDKITVPVPPVSLSIPPTRVLAVSDPPPISRLDARERLLSKARAEGRYQSESEEECELEEEEERRRERMTIVGSTVPVEVVLTPDKANVMESLGLVTVKCKKDLQEKLFRKRRKVVRERSQSPIELEDEAPNGLLSTEPLRPLPAVVLEGDKNSKDKLKFLLSLQLMAVPPEHRKEKEEMRRVCEQIRRRRAEKASAKTRRRQEKEQQELLEALNRGCLNKKRKYDDMLTHSIRSLDAPAEPSATTLTQLQENHVAAASTRKEQEKQQQQQRMNHAVGGVGAATEGSRTVIFPEGRDRHLSREFAEQFHESVLQSTRQKEHLQKLGHLSQAHHEAMSKPAPVNNHLPHSTASPFGENSAPFVWPGIEKVLESYMQHRREQQTEKRVLLEKCSQLHAHNVELTKAADTLCGHIEALREDQRRKAAQREQLEDALSNLKKCLCIPR